MLKASRNRSFIRLYAWPLFFCLANLSPGAADAQENDWRFSTTERIVTIGDVHGAFDALIETLQAADLVDSDLSWTGGGAHLVLTGDLMDRGTSSRRILDLIMRLEQEAPQSGGQVHLLLGNHEVMNLTGDLRYVVVDDYAAFKDLETDQLRDQWYQHFQARHPENKDEAALRRAFEKKAPPGYFGHRESFRHDGYYGAWLLEKPFLIVINDTAFVHGGLPPTVAERGLDWVNIDLKKDLYDYVQARTELADAGLLSPTDRFKSIPPLLVKESKQGRVPTRLADQAQRVLTLSMSPLHKAEGPTWYRGTGTCSELVEGDALQAALEKIGAERVVIGHSTTATRNVQQRMSGRSIQIDTGMLSSYYDGSGNALVIDNDQLIIVNQDGTVVQGPIDYPARVGHPLVPMNDSQLSDLLRSGATTNLSATGLGWQMVRVQNDSSTVIAMFRELDAETGFAPELAAYRLDRMLGLNMVPVTVLRKIDGKSGTLQFVPADGMSELERVGQSGWKGAPCPLNKQFAAMFMFDTLINNPSRTPANMLYSLEDWLLLLVDHDDAFTVETTRPTYLGNTRLVTGNQWLKALRNLDDASLFRQLEDALNKPQIEALMARRDALLNADP